MRRSCHYNIISDIGTLQIIRDYVSNHLPEATPLVTTAYKKNDGRIFGGQFMDGISNAVDAISMIR